MKKLLVFVMALPMVSFAQLQTVPPQRIVANGTDPAIRIVGSTNQAGAYVSLHNETNTLFAIKSDGSLTVNSLTNHIKFGATNAAPTGSASTPNAWVSVQISGDTNLYRMPLYK